MTAPPVALVTGAARGIGAAVVSRLLDRGFVVHALDACAGDDGGTAYPLASPADLDTMVALDPSRVVPVVADVRDLAALHRAAAAIGELDEAQRCMTFLVDSDPEAPAALGLG